MFPNRQREAMHQNRHQDEPERRTIKRRPDEPRLEIGATIEIKGMVGVVVAATRLLVDAMRSTTLLRNALLDRNEGLRARS